MKDSLKPGLSGTREWVVDRERTIDFMGEDARVYGTPMLVRDMEVACRELALAHLDPGEDTVGTRVEVDHLAATLLGMTVRFTVTLDTLAGRALTFSFQAHDGVDTVARGVHQRFVVDVAKTATRLAAKAQVAAAAAR